jgi:signal transduction histidine kinase
MLEVQVEDTGIGIKEHDLEKLFQLFGFLDSSSHLNTKGIGLGLHICQIIT